MFSKKKNFLSFSLFNRCVQMLAVYSVQTHESENIQIYGQIFKWKHSFELSFEVNFMINDRFENGWQR